MDEEPNAFRCCSLYRSSLHLNHLRWCHFKGGDGTEGSAATSLQEKEQLLDELNEVVESIDYARCALPWSVKP